MAEYIERKALIERFKELGLGENSFVERMFADSVYSILEIFPSADVAPVVHGRWILEAHKDREDYRWNVTAECSECCDERKEIWSGFFYDVPDSLARGSSLIDAKEVELSNYCPNCGAKMDLED